jgi:hypothetical protein
MLKQFNTSPLNLLLTGAVGFVFYKAYTGWRDTINLVNKAIDPVIDNMADNYAANNNPLIKPQIKLKSQYFSDFKLIPEALHVFKQYPNLFSNVFLSDGTIKAEYIHRINDGVAYSEDRMPESNQYNEVVWADV